MDHLHIMRGAAGGPPDNARAGLVSLRDEDGAERAVPGGSPTAGRRPVIFSDARAPLVTG